MKKTTKMVVYFNCLMVLLYLISCTNSNNKATSTLENIQKSNTKQVDTIMNKTSKASDSIAVHEILGGWLKEKIGQQTILEHIGKPEKKDKDEYWGATGTFVQNWEYSSLGILLEMESDKQGGPKKVMSIAIVSPCSLTTSQNIGIGSDVKLVNEKYLDKIDKSNSNNEAIVIGSLSGGTTFYLKNNIVNKIFIGALAE